MVYNRARIWGCRPTQLAELGTAHIHTDRMVPNFREARTANQAYMSSSENCGPHQSSNGQWKDRGVLQSPSEIRYSLDILGPTMDHNCKGL